MTLLLSTTIDPFKFINFANSNAHWSKKAAIKHRLYFEFYIANKMALKLIQLPVVAKIIRISPRAQDYDNFVYNCKTIVDFCCDCIKPGLAPGRSDGQGDIKIEYYQEKGQPKQYAIRIEIWKLNA